LARSFWELDSNENILLALFAVFESEYWDFHQITNWLENSVSSGQGLDEWLFKLIVAGDRSKLTEAFDSSFKTLGIIFKDDYDDVLAELLILKYRDGHLSKENLGWHLSDLMDTDAISDIRLKGSELVTLIEKRYSLSSKRSEEMVRKLLVSKFSQGAQERPSF